MDPFQILQNHFPPEATAALQQIFTTLTNELQDARQQVQAAQNQLLTQQQLEQSLTTALSQAQLTVNAPQPAPNAGTNNNTAANNDTANHAPMDLDAMQQSANVRCYNCNERGHVAKDCKRARRTGITKASPVSNGRSNGQRTYGAARPQQVHTLEMESEHFSNDNGDFFPQDLPDDYIPALDLEPLVSQEPTQQDERLTDDSDDPLYALVHEEMDTNPTYAIGLGPPNRDLHGSRAISVRALLDTGATSNYVTRDVARRAHAEFFRITPRDVVGAGKTTTTSMPMSWKTIRTSVMMFFLDGSGCVFIKPQSTGTRTSIS
ncbi:hypothetical protein BC835DRAFT_1307484 [Cytidiella melzeri]|nr:hypothetical protein BC835DRAFT_1307484 [Cytidiella melzeri]